VRIATLRVFNYKSFADSGEMHVQPGFNVVVGRNNVGKTALTEAMSLRFEDRPHRSQQTVPTPDAQPDPNSRVEVDFRVEADELRNVLSDELPAFYIPLVRDSELNTEGWFNSAVSDGARIKAVYGSQGLLSVQLLGFPEQTSENRYIRFEVDRSTGQYGRGQGIATGDVGSQDLRRYLADKFRERVYGFQAVRFGIDQHPISPARELATNASNLVQVLHLLTGNPKRWRRFVDSVRTACPRLRR
jgi:hypothetical protein